MKTEDNSTTVKSCKENIDNDSFKPETHQLPSAAEIYKQVEGESELERFEFLAKKVFRAKSQPTQS